MPAPDWIQHIAFDQGSYGARTHPLSDDEKRFLQGRDRAVTIAESQDPNACYSYDDWALCELDGEFYVFMTCGCSCPSPSETWSLMKCGLEADVLQYLQMTDYSAGYERTGEAFAEFLRQVEAAGWTLLQPAPVKGARSW